VSNAPKDHAATAPAPNFIRNIVEADLAAVAQSVTEGNVRLTGLQSEIDRMHREIQALGAVNLAALDELTAASERKTFLDAQSADLVEAMNTLEDAIRKIDSETRELLGSTQLGPRGAGLQHFDWVPEGVDAARVASMQVHAMANGQALTAMPLARQRVESVGIIEGQVHLRAADGSTLKQQDVLAFL